MLCVPVAGQYWLLKVFLQRVFFPTHDAGALLRSRRQGERAPDESAGEVNVPFLTV